jgi:hypothetical protein
LLLAVVVALWAALAWPLVSGERTLLLRDVMTTHLPYKWFGASELAEGSIPAVNPTWALGQPFRGNPNALPFYPGNLLYLALPFWSAFALHYMAHWLLALFAMRALARELGQSAEGALLAGLAYAGSGLFLSLLTFYNLLTVAAWAPLVLAGAVRGGRRGVAFGGLACGLMLLGGEPVAAAMIVPAIFVAAWERRRFAPALATAASIGGLGLVVALPQLVATARVLDFTWRAAHGLAADQVAKQALHPFRLLELVLPLPWGWPGSMGRFGFWSAEVTPHVPYIYSLHIGVVAAALAGFAACALPKLRRWSLLAAVALALAWAGGLSGEATFAATGGLFRYPQKLILLFTLAAAPLAGWGLDRARDSRAARRALAFAAAGCLAFAALAWALRAPLVELLRTRLATGGDAVLAGTAAAGWIVAFALAGVALALAAWALRAGRPLVAVAVQLVALLQLAPAFTTGRVSDYAALSPFGARIEPPRTLLTVPLLAPDWEPRAKHRLEGDGIVASVGVGWQNVEPPFGVPHGIRYPLAPDLEGMTSPLSVLLLDQLARADWTVRVAWLRRLGVGWVVRYGQEAVAGLERVEVGTHAGAAVGLDRVDSPASTVRWPAKVVTARNPIEAWRFVAGGGPGSGAEATEVAVTSRPVAHRPGASVRLVEERADRIVVDVAGEGGLLVVTRAYQPLYRARLEGGAELATQPVDIALLGVELPAGSGRVVIEIPSAPERFAGVVALVLALALVVVAIRSRA